MPFTDILIWDGNSWEWEEGSDQKGTINGDNYKAPANLTGTQKIIVRAHYGQVGDPNPDNGYGGGGAALSWSEGDLLTADTNHALVAGEANLENTSIAIKGSTVVAAQCGQHAVEDAAGGGGAAAAGFGQHKYSGGNGGEWSFMSPQDGAGGGGSAGTEGDGGAGGGFPPGTPGDAGAGDYGVAGDPGDTTGIAPVGGKGGGGRLIVITGEVTA